MSRSQTHEQALLRGAASILSDFSSSYEHQLQLLEASAAICGGFDIEEYWSAFGIDAEDACGYKEAANSLLTEIKKVHIPISLAISALSREPIPLSEQKKQGAFYTDYRLAQFAAGDCAPHLFQGARVADLAAGSGILLAAIAEKYYEKYPDDYDAWLSDCVVAFDLSENALRGARAALSVHAKSVAPLKRMCANWAIGDSLISTIIEDHAFDIVIGNPPWGKVKLTLHDFVNRSGSAHVYGSSYSDYDEEKFLADRQCSLDYSKCLKKKYCLLGNAEPDMYMAFLQRAINALKAGGHLSYLVPAGLIRSQGTEVLRTYLLDNSYRLKYFLLDNKPNYFAIDTRFKFVLVSHDRLRESEKSTVAFDFAICTSQDDSVIAGENISFLVDELADVRADLTIPECRNTAEKELFLKICKHGQAWEKAWEIDIAREVDMTNDKSSFVRRRTKHTVPVIEGRMVQQHRFGAKSYVSGSGRSAKWAPCAGKGKPQYYIDKNTLSDSLRERISYSRAGYCDIAGQTNERAMMSAVIPPDVVCGNKVPTIRFVGENSEQQLYFWIGVTNSFVFDWLIRRVISTTVNYFLLFSIPLPKIAFDHPLAEKIILATKELAALDGNYYTQARMQKLRSEIDVAVARAYGLSFSELELVLQDFPLLDRAQPSLNKEKRSTVTRDLILALAEHEYDLETHDYEKRLADEMALKAKAYIPSEMACLCERRKNK